jgi:cell division septation protein DedD
MFMEFKIGKDSDESQSGEAQGEKQKQRTKLVLLLILVCGLAYIYFFTGLIKPQVSEKTAEAPASEAPEVVKIPLPLREGETAKPPKPAAKAEAPKPAAVPVAKAAPAPVPTKPKEEPKKAEVKKPAAAEKKVAVAKESAKKPEADDQSKSEAAAKPKKSTSDSLTLVIGNYVLEEKLSEDMGRVRKAGFEPVVQPSTKKKSSMNRLLVGEFADRNSALATLENLKHHTSDAFVIEQNSKFVVYAGSYVQNESATLEKDRLKSAGFQVTVKRIDIAIPSQSISIGPFKNKKEADSAIGKLKSAGLKATFSQK